MKGPFFVCALIVLRARWWRGGSYRVAKLEAVSQLPSCRLFSVAGHSPSPRPGFILTELQFGKIDFTELNIFPELQFDFTELELDFTELQLDITGIAEKKHTK